ncbi:hypothetical protein DKL61_06465 [Gammaproteobacteria bacterium ESL0073]|nr:hypothetical protein DKL61_06465 [Gammaproteobacteria bacterium ESL0073]
MSSPIILNFDDSVINIKNATTIDLTSWQDDIRFGCSKSKFNQLKHYLDQHLPETYGTVLMGSGDYHHISLLLIERLKEKYSSENPIQVVVFDNHPDNMRYMFGIHCGSWVSYVASLPFVSHVHVLGITSNDIGIGHLWENRWLPLMKNKLTYWCMDVDITWAKRLGLGKSFKRFDTPDELIVAFLSRQDHDSQPVYLSIDKDVLSEETVKTNWDQGRLESYHVLDTISALNSRIIGSDITGDVSTWQYKSRLKRFLSSLDEQPAIPTETLIKWQTQQQKINTQIINALKESCKEPSF